MKIIDKILNSVGLVRSVNLRARYEVASPARAPLFPGQDSFSADAALNPGVRRAIRERCRTQIENDPNAEGIVDTYANDVVGTGPSVQVLSDDQVANDKIRDAFQEWAETDNLSEKLRLCVRAGLVDGEIFGLMMTNPRLNHPVKLSIKLIETEQVSDPNPRAFTNPTDGIILDEFDNPVKYVVLREHPGATMRVDPLAYDVFSADLVLHYFKKKRAGQHRGVSMLAPSLIRFAYLNRFTLATIVAAEHAANHAGIIYSEAGPDGAEAVEPMDTIEFDKGTWTTMPSGWRLEQMKAEHPSTTFEMFKKEMMGDAGRCVSMPTNVSTLNSSGYNFSSGKLDHLVYHKALGIVRALLVKMLLNRIFDAWLDEAALAGIIPKLKVGDRTSVKRRWSWPGMEAIDPTAESKATTENIANGTLTLERAHAEQGLDWRDELKQSMLEVKEMKDLMKKYGLEWADVAAFKGRQVQQQQQQQPKPQSDGSTQENANNDSNAPAQ